MLLQTCALLLSLPLVSAAPVWSDGIHTPRDHPPSCVDFLFDSWGAGILLLPERGLKEIPDFTGWPCAPFINRVNLQLNLIEEIRPGAWASLPNLTSIDISYNGIQNITRQSFEGAENIRELNLNQNRISRVERGSFDKLTKIGVDGDDVHGVKYFGFYIVGNPAAGRTDAFELCKCPESCSSVFQNIYSWLDPPLPTCDDFILNGRSVTVLGLAYRQLSEIPRFDAVKKYCGDVISDISWLDFTVNNIRVISKDAFDLLPKLTVLDFTNNDIELVEAGALARLRGVAERVLFTGNPFVNALDGKWEGCRYASQILGTDRHYCGCYDVEECSEFLALFP